MFPQEMLNLVILKECDITWMFDLHCTNSKNIYKTDARARLRHNHMLKEEFLRTTSDPLVHTYARSCVG